MVTLRLATLAMVCAGAAGLVQTTAACSSDGNPTSPAPSSTSTTPPTPPPNPAPNPPPPPPDSGTTTLYERLGKKAGITTAVDAIVAQELMDPEVASYFFFQVTSNADGGPPPVSGHPSAPQIKACLVNQLGAATGGPEQYPGVPSDNLGWQCRNMTVAHATLGIPNAVFNKFITIAATVLKSAGVSDADIATIGGALTTMKGQVVQDLARDGGSFIPPGDAGGG
jgi:hypothetical protein